jgi:HlyD family secretion protein
MNEHTIPTSETSRKLAPFSANTPIKRALAARRLWLVAGAAILGVVAVVGAAWWASATRGTVRYATSPVTRGIVARAVTATGTVNPELTIIVGAAVPSGMRLEFGMAYSRVT